MSEKVQVPVEYIALVDAMVEALPEMAEMTPEALQMIADATRKRLDELMEEAE